VISRKRSFDHGAPEEPRAPEDQDPLHLPQDFKRRRRNT
jgi:hypothetical protein